MTGADSRFERAIAAIDAANAADPNRIAHGGKSHSKELLHAELVTRWVRRLANEPSEALLLAARAHHLRRWTLPRSSHPEGRAGYHAWRRALQEQHAREAGEILIDVGYEPAIVARVGDLIRKRGLGRDAEVGVLEDALCLVFLETQLTDFAARHTDPKVEDVLVRSLRKMSPAGRAAAQDIPLSESERALLSRACAALE